MCTVYRRFLEELVNDPWAEGILDHGLSHHGNVISLGEAIKDLGGDHRRNLPEKLITPWKATA